MHHNILKSFIDQYKHCPKCGTELTIQAKHAEIENPDVFRVTTVGDRLVINITSSYFIKPGQDRFEFSISIIDGHIVYSDHTNQFISLYDLDILLIKDCRYCAEVAPPENFYRSIKIMYDRGISAFSAELYVESFSFVYDGTYYYFSNNFREKKSVLSAQTTDGRSRNSFVQTPYIPFEKFEFGNREKLFSKVNSIRLLV